MMKHVPGPEAAIGFEKQGKLMMNNLVLGYFRLEIAHGKGI